MAQGVIPFLFVFIPILEGARLQQKLMVDLSSADDTDEFMHKTEPHWLSSEEEKEWHKKQREKQMEISKELDAKLNSLIVGYHPELRGKLERLKEISDWFEGTLANQDTETSDSLKNECCCRVGRCLKDEKGSDGNRAMESYGRLCCKYRRGECGEYRDHFIRWTHYHEYGSKDLCENAVGKEIEAKISKVPCQKSQSGACHIKDCHATLRMLVKKMIDEAKRFCFHGSCVIDTHAIQLGEEMVHDLLVKGRALHDDGLGRKLFDFSRDVKLLWSGADKDIRLQIKSQTNAAEMSRGDDTAFARVMEDGMVNQAFNCSMPTFWEAVSGSFANVDSHKPLLMVLQKDDQSALEASTFWRTELKGIASNPPIGSIIVILVKEHPLEGLKCALVMENIRHYIQRLTRTTRSAKARWIERSGSVFACGEVSLSKEYPTSKTRLIRQTDLPSIELLNGLVDRLKSSGVPDSRGRSNTSVIAHTQSKVTDEGSSDTASARSSDRTLGGSVASASTKVAALNHYIQFPPPFVSAARLHDEFGASLEELLESGCSPEELQEAGFTNADMHAAGFKSFDFNKAPTLGRHEDWESFWSWAKQSDAYLDGPPSLNSAGSTVGHTIPDSKWVCPLDEFEIHEKKVELFKKELMTWLKQSKAKQSFIDLGSASASRYGVEVRVNLFGKMIAIYAEYYESIETIKNRLEDKLGFSTEVLTFKKQNGERVDDDASVRDIFGDYAREGYLLAQPPVMTRNNVLIVKSLSGKSMEVAFDASSKVCYLKKVIWKLWGETPVEEQTLVYAGKLLQDDRSLGSYHILARPTFHVFPTSVEVSVKNLDGQTLEIRCLASQGVLCLKENILKLEGIPIDKQELIYRGQEMREEEQLTLRNYGLVLDNNAKIDLIQRK